MPTPPLSDELAKQAADAFKLHGRKDLAAKALDLNYETYKYRLNVAAQRGMLGTDPVLPGYRIASTARQIGPDGATQKEWIQQKPEPGEPWEMPAGQRLKAVSALVDPDGRVILKWNKTTEDQNTVDLVDAIKVAFDGYKGFAALPPVPRSTDSDLATFYNISDHHLGLYAWAQEAGADYDLDIGARVLKDAMAALVRAAPPSETAIVLNLGDFFHADNTENRTARSGNVLDVDTRYAKVLRVGVDLMVDCVQLALQRHSTVLVRCLPGNHDPHTSLALSVALAAFFNGNRRVTVDCDPSRFFWWRWGSVFVGATHGDMVKPLDMPGVMASHRPEDWGATKHRYAYFGHVHHKSIGGGEQHGVVWETFQTLAAKDAWHGGMGFTSGRSMVAITHHRTDGEKYRHTVRAAFA